MGITTAESCRWLETLRRRRIHEHTRRAHALDSAIGDADHGTNMDRGLTRRPGEAADARGRDIRRAVQAGRHDPGLDRRRRQRTALRHVLPATRHGPRRERGLAPSDLRRGLRAGLDGIVGRGKAHSTTRRWSTPSTPAVEAMRRRAEADLAAALAAAATAAAAGRDRITPLVARKGRASYLGERAAATRTRAQPAPRSSSRRYATNSAAPAEPGARSQHRRNQMAEVRWRPRPGHDQHPFHDLRSWRPGRCHRPEGARADLSEAGLGRARPGRDLGAHARK